jgi:hypothetical protein
LKSLKKARETFLNENKSKLEEYYKEKTLIQKKFESSKKDALSDDLLWILQIDYTWLSLDLQDKAILADMIEDESTRNSYKEEIHNSLWELRSRMIYELKDGSFTRTKYKKLGLGHFVTLTQNN